MFLVQGNWRGGRLYPILQFPALGLMQLLKLQYTEKMSRFRWSSLYSPTNKSKLAFKFWHPRVHDYCTILCSRPSCVSRNTNKLLQQFLCTSAKNFMLIIGSAPVNFFYFIFLLKTKESASLAWLFLHTGRWPACIESVFYWICGSRIFSLETLLWDGHQPLFFKSYLRRFIVAM